MEQVMAFETTFVETRDGGFFAAIAFVRRFQVG
jgi:hypothetical protein